jgi:hypothetical protein
VPRQPLGGGAVEAGGGVVALPRHPEAGGGAAVVAVPRHCVCAGWERQTWGWVCGVPRQADGGAPR